MISNSPESLRQAWSHDQGRMSASCRLLDIYGHKWELLLKERMRKQFRDKQTYENLCLHADTSLNPLRWATDQLGAIYSRPAMRSVEGSEDGSLDPYLANGTLDLALDQAAKLTSLTRELFLRPLVVRRGNTAQISIDVITPDRVVVMPSHDPLAIDAIMYSIPASEKTYVYWDKEIHYKLDAQFETIPGSVMENPYGLIPFVPVHALYPARGFWHLHDAGALEAATLQAGVDMTNLRYLMKMQSFKQIAIQGMVDEKQVKIVADPGQVLEVPNGQIQMLDWTAHLREIMDVILQQVGAVLNFFGLRPDAVRGTSTASSGYALTIERHDLELAWEQSRVIWRVWENMLYQIARIVWDTDLGLEDFADLDLPPLPEGEMQVQYAEVGPGRDPKEQAETATAMQNAGWSVANTMREVYGKDEEWIEANQMEKMSENPMIDTSMDAGFMDEPEPEEESTEGDEIQ